MKEFLKENSVAVAGICVAILSAILYTFGGNNILGRFAAFNTYSIGLIYGFAIGFATINRNNKNLIAVYALISEVIYLGVFWLSVLINAQIKSPEGLFNTFLQMGIPCGIGAVLLLYLTKKCLHLTIKKIIYLIFFFISLIIVTLCFGLEKDFISRMTIAVPIWQIAFALGLNEIIKRQQDSFKTNSQKANSF